MKNTLALSAAAVKLVTTRSFASLLPSAVAVGALCASSAIAEAGGYVQTDLVSNIPGLASLTDPHLVNPWGVSFIGPAPPAPFSSPFWISNQVSNTTTLYAVTGSTSVSKVPINGTGFVAIPTTPAGPQGPTGQVSNTNSSSFPVGNGGDGKQAFFIFANLNGTISAWDPGAGASAIIQSTTPGALYTGLAKNQAQTELYAANDSAGTIDVFNSTFNPIASPFATPSAISAKGLVPFNVEDIGGSVFVTYAPMGHANQIAALAGDGAVAVFNESGVVQKTIIGGPLASPWGVAPAPANFGPFGGDWLFGNFSYADPGVEVFNPATDSFVGSIPINLGGHAAGGLWDLTFGAGGSNGSPSTLYFTDGIDGELNGLFGAVAFVPEPSTWAMMALGFGGLGLAGWRSRRRSVSIAV
jgi:uncharacterized protein (TIGR03118 family)